MASEEYETHKTAIKTYLKKFDDIKIRVLHNSEHNRAYYQKQAKKLGYISMNNFVIALMDYAIKNKIKAKEISSIDNSDTK